MPSRRYDDDDDRPRPRRRHDDDDDRDDGRHRHKPKKSGASPVLIIGGIGGGLLLLGGAAVAAIFLLRDKPAPPASPTPFPDMVAHWSFEEAPAERIPDMTKRGNTGVVAAGRLGPGIKGQGFWFDGRDDQYIDLSQAKDLNFTEGSEFTIAAWFQTPEKVGTILSFRHTDRPCQLDLFVRDNRAIGIVGDDADTTGEHAFCWCKVPNDGNWHHVALTRSGRKVELYYDGAFQEVHAANHAGGPITTNLRAIGCERMFVETNERRFGRAGFKGGIDEVYVFSRALPIQEIQALMKR
jgi:hypothetical protein